MDVKPVAWAVDGIVAALPLVRAFKTTLTFEKIASADIPLYDQSTIDALQARIDALEVDAGRYRWLRTQPNDTSAPRIDVCLWQIEDESANAGTGLRMEMLDAAIDAAIAAGASREPTAD